MMEIKTGSRNPKNEKNNLKDVCINHNFFFLTKMLKNLYLFFKSWSSFFISFIINSRMLHFIDKTLSFVFKNNFSLNSCIHRLFSFFFHQNNLFFLFFLLNFLNKLFLFMLNLDLKITFLLFKNDLIMVLLFCQLV